MAEKSYGGSCIIYDHENPDNPWHNVWDKFDAFVPTHFFGVLMIDNLLKVTFLTDLVS